MKRFLKDGCRGIWLGMAVVAVCATQPVLAEKRFDPAVDIPSKEWCYLAESAAVIGLPFAPEPVQVTYDGAIYTMNAELCFFYGEDNKPIYARQKTLLAGWIPVIQYSWEEGGIEYSIEMFSAKVPPLKIDNLVQFARFSMKNVSHSSHAGVISAGIRGSAGQKFYRMRKCRWQIKPGSQLAFKDRGFRRDGKLVYSFSAGAELQAIPGTPYAAPFKASNYSLDDSRVCGMVSYRRDLKPGESFSAIFRMPRVFLRSQPAIQAVEAADYDEKRTEIIRYWKRLIEGKQAFSLPEERVDGAYKASLVHLILATRGRADGSGRRQGSGLPYDALFLNDYMDMLQIYDLSGLPQFAEPNVDWLLKKQYRTGMFIDVHNRGNDEIVTSHGQALFALAFHYVITRDKAYAAKVWPAVQKGVELIIHDHHTMAHGLLRPSVPYDAPMLTGQFMCHNLFAYAALEDSIRMARMLGKTAEAERWQKEQRSYRAAILKAADDSMKSAGYIRSGLYDWTPGNGQGRKNGPPNRYPNQDWENNLLIWPTELMRPNDARLLKTVAEIRRRRYCEGVMTYRNGMHIHQYVTLNQAEQYLAMNDQQHALSDLYHVLLHNGSVHEGFENLVEPWTRIVRASCPPPHAWAAAKTALFIRNAMVREYGGERGLEPQKRGLYLFSLISPAWVKPGNKLEIRNAVTEMGHISATMRFIEGGAEVSIKPDFREKPAYLALTIPWFVELESVRTDKGKDTVAVREGKIYLNINVSSVQLRWKLKPEAFAGTYQNLLKMYRSEYGSVGPYLEAEKRYSQAPPKAVLTAEEQSHPAEPLSFDLVRRAFAHEYTRRFREHVAAGGAVDKAAPPEIWKSKPVTASGYIDNYLPEKAVDGNHTDLQSSWQADPYPAWLQLDLGEMRKISSVHVWPYWGNGRYYKYTVKVSGNRVDWDLVGDNSKNTKPSTPKGDVFNFEPREVRFVRIDMLYHNLNNGVHIVEVEVE